MWIEELSQKYKETFGDDFPTMCFQTATDEEFMDMIRECLAQGKPAKVIYGLDASGKILY